MDKDTKNVESRPTFYLSLTTRKAQVTFEFTLHIFFINFNYRQIILNKPYLRELCIFFGSVTWIWQLADLFINVS